MCHIRHRVFSALAFLVLWRMFCVADVQPCRSQYSVYGMTLKGYIYKKTEAANWPSCVQACNDDVICQSINYVIGEGICELNNRTKEARPNDFVSDKGRAYMTRLGQKGIASCTHTLYR